MTVGLLMKYLAEKLGLDETQVGSKAISPFVSFCIY